MTGPRITPERRRALELLASDAHGATKEFLLLAHGFDSSTIADLVRTGLAAEEREWMKAGGKTIEVVRVRITNAGWRAIEGN
jgi:hypothetical protein